MNADFRSYFESVRDWLILKNEFYSIDTTYEAIYSNPTLIPSESLLWSGYLRVVLPAELRRILSKNPYLLSNLVNRFQSLGTYSVKRHFIEILEKSNLISWVEATVDDVIDRLVLFHTSLDKWFDGSWHTKFQENNLDALAELQTRLRIESVWDVALFLTSIGYPYPCSKHGYAAWNRFKGDITTTEPPYTGWYRLLRDTFCNPLDSFKADRVLDVVFTPNDRVSPMLDCHFAVHCATCPVMEGCGLYIAKTESKRDVQIEDDIRLDQLDAVSTERLVKYLAGRRYDHSRSHDNLIQSFIEDNNLTLEEQPLTSVADERLALFVRGLREVKNRKDNPKKPSSRESFTCSATIIKFVKPLLMNETQESFYTMILDNKHRMIRLQHITKGTLNQSLVHPREVFAPSIQLRAAAVILIHNHPSGDPSPSTQDIEITKRLIEVGDIVGIKVLDHVIIGKQTDFSFVDEDILF